MAEMKTERKNVLEYLSKNKFLIPMYQRAYVWQEDECQQLWDDIYNFFDNKDDDSNEEYFLGSIVVYREKEFQNIIDGQQRTTTLSLLIRAIYEKTINQKKENVEKLKSDLESCLWDVNPLTGKVDYYRPHLKSEVAIDSDNEALSAILSDRYKLSDDRNNKEINSNYEKNYLYFIRKIDELSKEKPIEWFNFCLCLLSSCIVLPIECDNRENALRIFNTLNNRGVSLNASDIFKGIMYASKEEEERNDFTKRWKYLETKINNSTYLKKEDIGFLFTQYEHIIRAINNEVDTVIPSTLEFFTKKDKLNSKKKNVNFGANEDMLRKNDTFDFIEKLADFWCNPDKYLSEGAKKYFDILNLYQNKLWQMVLSMCFYMEETHNKQGKFGIFDDILPQLVSYCALGLIYGKGGTSGLLWGLMNANIRIKNKQRKIFESSLNIPDLHMPKIDRFTDFCTKALPRQIRYILAIHTFIYNPNQEWEWNLNRKNYSVMKGEVEHILPKKWKESNYAGWDKKEADKFLEYIGNKILLEKKVNIDAGNEYFGIKKEQYLKSHFLEVKDLGGIDRDVWLKQDIELRNELIYERLKNFFEVNLLGS